MPFAPIENVVQAIEAGRMVVLVDDEQRENEGDLVMAAEHADEAAIAFMATRGCGLICLAMEGEMLDRLGLPLMTRNNRSRLGTAFTLSIEAAEGVTTGISAADRSRTIATAIAPEAKPEDIVSPGHVFPLRAQDGGSLVRAGHSEASVDLARLAGCRGAAVICEIMRSDGKMARLPDLQTYCAEHGLLLASIADLIAYRERSECLVELTAEAQVSLGHQRVQAYAYRSMIGGAEHLALVWGDGLRPGAELNDPVLVRVQQAWPLSDVFAVPEARNDLPTYLAAFDGCQDGVLLYLRDGQGGWLSNQLVALGGERHIAPERPQLTMDPRDYGIGAQILRQLGVRRMRLLTTSDRPLSALSGHGLEIVERLDPLSRAPAAARSEEG